MIFLGILRANLGYLIGGYVAGMASRIVLQHYTIKVLAVIFIWFVILTCIAEYTLENIFKFNSNIYHSKEMCIFLLFVIYIPLLQLLDNCRQKLPREFPSLSLFVTASKTVPVTLGGAKYFIPRTSITTIKVCWRCFW